MKQFKLKRVKYKNIMSVGQQAIEIKLDDVHKSLVTGTNGAGKSTMIEAVTFALFGKPFRPLKLAQLINSSNKKELLVELDMEFGGHAYEIVRGQKPTIFKIKKDGVPLDEAASSKDFQEYFESLIGMNYASFKQIVVLGTAGYTPFMNLRTPERRKLVEDLLEVTVLADMDKLNKAEIRELNQQLKVSDLKAEHVRAEIRTHEEYAERQRKLSGDNITRLKTMYDDLVKEAHGNKDQIVAIADQIVELVLPEDFSKAISESSYEQARVENKIADFKQTINLYNKGGHCPTCMQDLDSSSPLITKVKDTCHDYELKASTLLQERQGMKEKQLAYDSVVSQISALKTQQAQLKQLTLNVVEKAKKVKAALTAAESEFVDNSDKIKELQDELSKVIDIKAKMMVEIYRRGCITEMLKDSGIKGAIVKKYIPLFNKQINSYLKIMGADYVFTLDEEFNETIKSRGRESFSYSSFSQGEKARIDIALLFTWRNIASLVTGINISCLFLDEVFDSATDAEGVKAIATILKQMPDSNIFIISHRDHNPDDYGQHLRMKKVGRFTIMEK